ncbi:coxsackievirus and adenovirus receptor-like [Lethenteron reissneri]|uniref:coxsackievirus and adenovirus receptor-like n=1 Tax=Lethenteron reissneri TaxID=7753 RepID=UPI002AB69F21|nr:coxsackievirus and adenovirus receptor-like [Lethenteron reissneri]
MVVTPEKVNAVAGSKILLPCSYTCTISGVTHTLVEWFRMMDGREEERIYKFPNGDEWPLHATWMGDVSKCDASITVSDIKTNDSGRYRCEVTVYPQKKHDIGYLQLNVNSPSEFAVVTPDKMDAMAGTTFLLPCSYTCTISGVTHTLVEWLRIIDGREERIYQFSEGESSHWPLHATSVGNVSKCDASINVSDIQTHDSGRYRCEVSVYPQNKQDIGYLQLIVHPRTDLAVVTTDAKDTTVGSTALLPCSYTCNITGIRHTLVEWFRTIDGHDEKVYKTTHRKSLRPLQVTWVGNDSTCDASITISNIQTHDAGRYRCEVTIYRHDKPTMEDIGYLQLNVPNEPEPRDATPTPTPTPAPAPVAGIVLGVIAALLVVAVVVGFYCWKKRQSQAREPEVPPQEMQPMNPIG